MKSIVLILLVCLALQGRGQLQCANTMACTTDCLAMTGSCCVLELDTANTEVTPLGFIVSTLPGTDSALPSPCARIMFPQSAVGRVNYLVVAVETAGTTLCIRESGTVQVTCGNSGIFFCNNVVVGSNRVVDIDLLCEGVGPSCEAADSSFFIKAVTTTLDNDVEDFCDVNGTIPLPSSLRVPPTIITNCPTTTDTTDTTITTLTITTDTTITTPTITTDTTITTPTITTDTTPTMINFTTAGTTHIPGGGISPLNPLPLNILALTSMLSTCAWLH